MRATLIAVAFAAIAGGCGSDASSATSSSGTTQASTPAASVPQDLVGTYTTTVRKADLPPSPPPELTGTKDWKLTVAKTGGVDGGPVFAISSSLGNLESPTFTSDGKIVVIKREECAAGGNTRFYDNEYAYTVKGDALRFTTVKNQCPDKVAETILTSRAWKRTSGAAPSREQLAQPARLVGRQRLLEPAEQLAVDEDLRE